MEQLLLSPKKRDHLLKTKDVGCKRLRLGELASKKLFGHFSQHLNLQRQRRKRSLFAQRNAFVPWRRLRQCGWSQGCCAVLPDAEVPRGAPAEAGLPEQMLMQLIWPEGLHPGMPPLHFSVSDRFLSDSAGLRCRGCAGWWSTPGRLSAGLAAGTAPCRSTLQLGQPPAPEAFRGAGDALRAGFPPAMGMPQLSLPTTAAPASASPGPLHAPVPGVPRAGPAHLEARRVPRVPGAEAEQKDAQEAAKGEEQEDCGDPAGHGGAGAGAGERLRDGCGGSCRSSFHASSSSSSSSPASPG